MYYIRIIKYYYIFITVLAVLAPVDYPFYKMFPALFLMWFSYFLFKKGNSSVTKLNNKVDSLIRVYDTNKKQLIIYVLFALMFIPIYVDFYTGSSAWDALLRFFSSSGSESNYYLYQTYFKENNLNQFTILKLPYIILLGIFKLLFWYFFVYYISFKEKNSIIIYSLLFILFFAFFLIGVSRGTSFENFEMLIVLIFSLLLRNNNLYNYNYFTKKQLSSLLIIILIATFYFIIGISLRYQDMEISTSHVTSTLRYNEHHFIAKYFNFMASPLMGLSLYFLFPIYFISNVFWLVWFDSVNGLFSLFIPFSSSFLLNNDSYTSILCRITIDCGAAWQPDMIALMFYTGVPLFLYLVYLLGKLAKFSNNKILKHGDVVYALLLLVIIYQMISFPTGNFIVVSSANKISVFLILIIIMFNMFKSYRYR